MIRKRPFLFFCIPLILLGVGSCASYKDQYSKQESDWQDSSPLPEKAPIHTMYLVGDAGNAFPGSIPPVLNYLKGQLDKESKNSSILFLGDNIYPAGMPPEEDSLDRQLAEYRIGAQLKILDNFKGR